MFIPAEISARPAPWFAFLAQNAYFYQLFARMKTSRNIFPLLLLAALPLLTVSCRLAGRRSPAPRPPVKVATIEVNAAVQTGQESYIGEIVSPKSVTLTAPYPGTLSAIRVKKGDMLSAGQAVATVQSAQAENAARIARVTYAQAKDAYDRLSAVYAEGGVSEVQMIDIKTQLEKAESARDVAEKALRDGTVRAPFRGMVTEVHADPGVELAPLQPLVSLHDMSDLSVRISVHEHAIGDIRPGMAARVDIPALGIEDFPATVKEKDLLSSALSHSYACRLTFNQPLQGLMPGMSVKVRIPRQGIGHIVIPAAAVQLDQEGRYVWLNDGGIVSKMRVQVGGYSGKGVVITEGLLPGDRVIVQGYQKVSSGMKVIE